jgi:hypothetical protein
MLKFLWDWGVGIQSIEFQRCNSFDPKGLLRGISYGLEFFKIHMQIFQSKEALSLILQDREKSPPREESSKGLVHVLFCPTNFLLIIG